MARQQIAIVAALRGRIFSSGTQIRCFSPCLALSTFETIFVHYHPPWFLILRSFARSDREQPQPLRAKPLIKSNLQVQFSPCSCRRCCIFSASRRSALMNNAVLRLTHVRRTRGLLLEGRGARAGCVCWAPGSGPWQPLHGFPTCTGPALVHPRNVLVLSPQAVASRDAQLCSYWWWWERQERA